MVRFLRLSALALVFSTARAQHVGLAGPTPRSLVDLFKCSAGPTLQVLHPPLPSLLACLNDMAYLFSTAMANPFDLNVRVEEDDDDNLPFDLNEAILEDHTTYGNVLSSFVLFLYSKQQRVLMFLIFFLLFWTRFDLNLPLDEFGAVDFDYLQNLPGKVYK